MARRRALIARAIDAGSGSLPPSRTRRVPVRLDFVGGGSSTSARSFPRAGARRRGPRRSSRGRRSGRSGACAGCARAGRPSGGPRGPRGLGIVIAARVRAGRWADSAKMMAAARAAEALDGVERAFCFMGTPANREEAARPGALGAAEIDGAGPDDLVIVVQGDGRGGGPRRRRGGARRGLRPARRPAGRRRGRPAPWTRVRGRRGGDLGARASTPRSRPTRRSAPAWT